MSDRASAILKKSGEVIVISESDETEDTPAPVAELQSGIYDSAANSGAFAAVTDQGKLITWGDPKTGGNAQITFENVRFKVPEAAGPNDLKRDVLFGKHAVFASFDSDGLLRVWGDPAKGGKLPADAQAVLSPQP